MNFQFSRPSVLSALLCRISSEFQQITMQLTKFKQIKPLFQACYFSTSRTSCLIQKWRQERGLPLNPNTAGVLTDGADYSYLDGRPSPLGVRQKNRMIKQEAIAGKIIQLSKEVDFAIARHQQMQEDHKLQIKNILNNKLKAKGKALL